MDINNCRDSLERKKGQRDQLLFLIKQSKNKIKSLKRNVKEYEEAQLIAQKAAQETQRLLEVNISDIVSMALASVFENPYEFELNFIIKRGKTEAELFFIRDGERVNPINSSGGGVVDVASFALRIACWKLQTPRSNSTIILDEPFKNLSKDLQEKASEMLKLLSEKMNLQFIIVTHETELKEAADKIFTIKQKKGVSYVD